MNRNRPALYLCALITTLWVASMVRGFVSSTYATPAVVNALMMMAAGWAFGKGLGGKDDPGD